MTIEAKVVAATKHFVSMPTPKEYVHRATLTVRGETGDGEMVIFSVPLHQANCYPVGRRVKVTVEPRGR